MLVLVFFFLPPKSINSQAELSKLEQNQKILLSGTVIEEKQAAYSKTLFLDNNLSVVCSPSCPTYLNKKINVLGILDKYAGKEQIHVLRIES